MSIQTYRTRQGAERYAAEIVAKFPSVQTAVVPGGSGFDYVVRVTTSEGRTALAGKRPRWYGANGYAAILAGNFRIAGSDGL